MSGFGVAGNAWGGGLKRKVFGAGDNGDSMEIERRQSRSTLVLAGVFLVCLVAGVVAGDYLKERTGDVNAASANITVLNSEKIITVDQTTATQTLTLTSAVTVRDSVATSGYTIIAGLAQNTIPNSVVRMQADSFGLSGYLTEHSVVAVEERTNAATTPEGHTTTWTLTATVPANISLGNYIIDIEYREEAIPDLTTITTMQQATTDLCEDSLPGLTVNLVDTRDNKTYRVRKMVDNRCWMIDNLAYDINSAPAEGKPAYATTPEYDDTPSGVPNLTFVGTTPQYAQNASVYNIPNNGNPTPSYLYNWCAAMGDTSTNCATTVGYMRDQPVTPQVGICPAPFRLPVGGAGATTPSDGTNQITAVSTTTNEFAKLDIYMGGTGTNRLSATNYSQWTNVDLAAESWLGVLTGYYYDGLSSQGSSGSWWSSTASTKYVNSDSEAYHLHLNKNGGVNPANDNARLDGFAVRCIL